MINTIVSRCRIVVRYRIHAGFWKKKIDIFPAPARARVRETGRLHFGGTHPAVFSNRRDSTVNNEFFFFVQITDNARPDRAGGCFPFTRSRLSGVNLPSSAEYLAAEVARSPVRNWEVIGRLQ